jgi:ferredoxin--NADP+ reductase
MAQAALNAIVTQRSEVAPGLIILRVAPEDWALPAFTAGQFAVLGLPGSAPRYSVSDPEEPAAEPDRLIRRSYSIASSSLAGSYLEFYITLVRSGELTPRLFALGIGDRVWLGPKITGTFTLDRIPAGVHLVLVATGTGLAPYMSMLRSGLLDGSLRGGGLLAASPSDGGAQAGSRRRVAVLLGARHSWDLGYQAELATHARLSANFSLLVTLSRPEEEPIPWQGHAGRVEGLWTDGSLARSWGFAPSPDDTHVLLCGNPGMIDNMVGLLAAEGYAEHKKSAPGQVHLERYW